MRKTLLLTTILTALAIGPAAAQQPAAPVAEAPAAAAQHADTVLIRSIQRALVARGYFDGPVTGSVDAATEDAIRRYQTDHGLTVDGVASHALANHIRTGQTVAQANAQRQQEVATGVGVAVVAPEYAVSTADRWIALGQTVMAKAGIYDGPVNGVYDRPTRDAVLRVEADNGLPATGRISDVLIQASDRHRDARGGPPPGRFRAAGHRTPADLEPAGLRVALRRRTAVPASLLEPGPRLSVALCLSVARLSLWPSLLSPGMGRRYRHAGRIVGIGRPIGRIPQRPKKIKARERTAPGPFRAKGAPRYGAPETLISS